MSVPDASASFADTETDGPAPLTSAAEPLTSAGALAPASLGTGAPAESVSDGTEPEYGPGAELINGGFALGLIGPAASPPPQLEFEASGHVPEDDVRFGEDVMLGSAPGAGAGQ